jgi:hypothetical protein
VDATGLRYCLAGGTGRGMTREHWRTADGSSETIQLPQAFGGAGRSALGCRPLPARSSQNGAPWCWLRSLDATVADSSDANPLNVTTIASRADECDIQRVNPAASAPPRWLERLR